MSVSGDYESNEAVTNSSNFWELKNYSRTVKRVDNAYKLCTELCNMLTERAEIEKNYAAHLKKWGSKWQTFLESGVEYGTGKEGWNGFCVEAEKLSDIHQDIRAKLTDEVVSNIKTWQKDHFKKTALQSLKETKQLESEFENAQKPWAKRYKKVQTCKKDYHNAVKNSRSAKTQLQAGNTDPGTNEQEMTPESLKQQKKLQDKLKKAEKEEEKMKNNYESSLKELDQDNPRYVEDMTAVFKKSQDSERERLDFFKGIYYDIHKVIDISERRDLPEIYLALKDTIDHVNVDADLNFWSETSGADMPILFPVFEEYSPESCNISRNKGTKSSLAPDGVTLTAINTNQDYSNSRQNSFRASQVQSTHYSSESNSAPRSADSEARRLHKASYNEELNPFNMDNSSDGLYANINNVQQNPFESCDSDNMLVDDGRPGVPIRALYDYTGAEDDELTFRTGDLFEKLEDEDEQGWCKGRKDGRVGLYPANYVELV